MKKEDLVKLAEPLDLRWRVQTAKGQNALCVAYVDARAVQQRLDDVCGVEGWQNTYDAESGVSSIGINVDGEWIWKSDIGTESNIEKEKGKASDAFKRAAVLWGIGRNLYSIGEVVLPSNGKQATTKNGQTLFTGKQLTDYINGLNTECSLLMQVFKPNQALIEAKCKEEFKQVYETFKNKQ